MAVPYQIKKVESYQPDPNRVIVQAKPPSVSHMQAARPGFGFPGASMQNVQRVSGGSAVSRGRSPQPKTNPNGLPASPSAQPVRAAAQSKIVPAQARSLPEDKLTDSFSDLKHTLEQHHCEASEPDSELSDNEVQATQKIQLVQKALATAPESKVRDLCAMVACQQVEQEIFLRMLRTNMDALQGQVQSLSGQPGNELDTTKMSQPLVQPDFDELLKTSIDAESKKLWYKVEDKIFQQETELMSWLANFCASTIAETLGDEVQRHSEALQSLDTQVNDLREIAEQNLQAWQQLLAENAKSKAAQEASFDGNSLPKAAPAGVLAQLDSINSKDCIEGAKDPKKAMNRIDYKWVLRLYKDLIPLGPCDEASSLSGDRQMSGRTGSETRSTEEPSDCPCPLASDASFSDT